MRDFSTNGVGKVHRKGLKIVKTLAHEERCIGIHPQNNLPVRLSLCPSAALLYKQILLTISPLRGALVYNTDQDCLHYYDGTQWINICEAFDNAFYLASFSLINRSIVTDWSSSIGEEPLAVTV